MAASCCILLVDDEAMNRDALSRRLGRQGYQVVLADSGTRALELLEKHHFDMVLLDVMMPEVNGLQVLATIRETKSHAELPVIMVSARDQGGDVVAALQMGASDYVTKPVNYPVLLARIQTQLQIQQSKVSPRMATPTPCSLSLGSEPTALTASGETDELEPSTGLPSIQEPPHVPGYEFLEVLGSGGLGTVYKARHSAMDRLVALKLLNPDRVQRSAEVKRFYQEMRAIAQMSHPNIVTAYEVGETSRTHYIAREYVEGTDLDKLVRDNGPLPLFEASLYIRQAAQGLQHASERGYVHRDVKPSNLLVHSNLMAPPASVESKFTPRLSGSVRRSAVGVVKILDLGLASLKRGNTSGGGVFGAADYMAPEQWKDSQAVDVRADLYSLGCTFYYLLTGLVPFPGNTSMEKMLKHTTEAPIPIEKLRPSLPPSAIEIIGRLLAKRPADRYQTPEELASHL